MIIADQISKHFNDIQAVKNISFEVKQGETMVLLGTSGCGKTTTLKMLNRLIDATSGNITIDGKNIFQEQPEILRRTIGYVSQNNGLFPHFTVAQNLAVVPKLLGWKKDKILQRSGELLDQLKLPFNEFGNKYPDELSGGQKQRVSLARALIADPPVLLMDEPFGALDPVTRSGIRKEFKQLPELKSKTIVLVTHDVQEAFELGDHVCLMDKGQIVQSGTPEALIFNPENDFARSFFKDQRLLLQLKSLSLKTIWNQLSGAPNASKADITSDESLWGAMEILSEKQSQQLVVGDLGLSEQKIVTLAVIETAFNHIQNRR
ncbi:ABC transporter ATP-binding protein [Dyadobacter pollutisoli]|uniref:ATP-binding cassette domain-containing protein n=1 Tax=Dyadobacter pollutisoli TaxID=2910158 RepID=A0A9E8SRR5_9BACT|nr:ATP-binding cassette domain-containing protein [Dyadobacter pollutisoli]WAC14492.1 ATP-binding cassette domain-containing protein [Dyadobacter pollutisoli]